MKNFGQSHEDTQDKNDWRMRIWLTLCLPRKYLIKHGLWACVLLIQYKKVKVLLQPCNILFLLSSTQVHAWLLNTVCRWNGNCGCGGKQQHHTSRFMPKWPADWMPTDWISYDPNTRGESGSIYIFTPGTVSEKYINHPLSLQLVDKIQHTADHDKRLTGLHWVLVHQMRSKQWTIQC